MGFSDQNRWLHRFAVLSAVATWMLIGIGGLVTSHEAGMAVPDWPTTYGYNMFLFPPSQWIGGVFYEHSHRLFASFVGLLTTVLAIWLWLKEDRRWLKVLGVCAFFGVVAQGVLGGLRVTLMMDSLGIPHAALAQLFLVLLSVIAVATSGWWKRQIATTARRSDNELDRGLLLGLTFLIFGQLLLGAAMRHEHAGLAIPDFPLAYGQIWPRTDAAFIDKVNRERIHVMDPNPITAAQIYLHMAHRICALVILFFAGWLAWRNRRAAGVSPLNRGFAMALLGLILVQASFGVITVWSNKAADVATVHVMIGAVSLVGSALFCVISARCGSVVLSDRSTLDSSDGSRLSVLQSS